MMSLNGRYPGCAGEDTACGVVGVCQRERRRGGHSVRGCGCVSAGALSLSLSLSLQGDVTQVTHSGWARVAPGGRSEDQTGALPPSLDAGCTIRTAHNIWHRGVCERSLLETGVRATAMFGNTGLPPGLLQRAGGVYRPTALVRATSWTQMAHMPTSVGCSTPLPGV